MIKEGIKAPDFKGLKELKGKNVVLFFYPKDDTPGCTAEACSFRDNYQSLVGQGFEVIGVSIDDEKSHKKFESKYNLPFTLIADNDKKIVEEYGVWGEKSMYGKTYMGTARTTFIINSLGTIQNIITKVDNQNATQQVLDLLG